MSSQPKYPAGYGSHTMRTRKIVLEAELRHCWDLLAVFRACLHHIEDDGGPRGLEMLPGEHYRISVLASKTCTRARKVLAEFDGLQDQPEHEAKQREEFMAAVDKPSSETGWPGWHVKALGAIRELAAVPKFGELAIDKGRFDAVPRGPRALFQGLSIHDVRVVDRCLRQLGLRGW